MLGSILNLGIRSQFHNHDMNEWTSGFFMYFFLHFFVLRIPQPPSPTSYTRKQGGMVILLSTNNY